MKFKVRTYKKSGNDKRNMDYEKIFLDAESAMTEYKRLFSSNDGSLKSTLWVSDSKEWTQYNKDDFKKLFLNGKRCIDITQNSVNCCNELIVDTEKGTIEAFYELGFDIDRYFGTNINEKNSTWIEFYTYWHTDGHITAKFFIDSEDIDEYPWILTEPEQKFFLDKMEKYSKSVYHLSLEKLFKRRKNLARLKFGEWNESERITSLEPEEHITVNGKEYLYGPLSEISIHNHMDKDNYISGVIKIHISDMIDSDFEGFLDFVSTELVGSTLLMNIDYEVLGACKEERNTLYLLVSGDVSNVLGEDRLVFDLSKVKKDGVIQDVSGVKRKYIGKPYHITEITDTMIEGTIGADGYIYSLFPSFLEYEEFL